MKQKICLGDCYALTKHTRKQTTIRYISLLAVLVSMCLYAVKQVSAQQAEPVATAVANIKPLKIGDTIPEYLWHFPLQVVNHDEGKGTITLNDYRGKLILLDFWSTNCGSCIGAMPQLFKVQDYFDNDIVVMPITYKDQRTVVRSIRSIEILTTIGMPSIVNDSTVSRYFPHKSISHMVWITSNGLVRATTGTKEVTIDNVSKILSGSNVDLIIKHQ